MKKLFIIIGGFIIISSGCKQETIKGNLVSEHKNKIKMTDIEWSEQADNPDKHLEFFADEAIVLAPGQPILSGKKTIKDLLERYHSIPGFKIHWEPVKVEVAESGDLGYSLGTYVLTMQDSLGNEIKDYGKYVTIWKAYNDSLWKVSVDMFNSNK
ncbi:nuclear transport factor 2 family protein [Zhouia spongiae]|uniref:Nuclear transport factor 2 family protein n=1 Tax=Zhouia spongiae TaxID=2202721 RepID=A0ABY3YNG0_9FLAO|nr:nuclear transport factor 2 family protein [Zhouia spongiae]UNY99122.1 nuclear transport factor 2 family protein [Zhouia spongiae]